MPRNGSNGTYTAPITFVADTLADVAEVNAAVEDLGDEITNSVAKDGQTTMTGPLKAADGSASAPGYTFGSDANTGIYRISSDTIGLAVGGAEIARVNSSGITLASGKALSGNLASDFDGDLIADGTLPYAAHETAAIADAAAYRAKTASKLLSTSVWDAADTVALSYGTSVALDLATGLNFTLTLTGNAAISNPTNVKVGQSGFIAVTQDATGGRSLTFGSNFKWVDGTAATADTTASRVNIYTYVCISSTFIWLTMARGVR